MIRATISQLRNGLSAYLRRVRRGETVLVMDRKFPVARLTPVGGSPGLREEPSAHAVANQELEDEARLARLEAAGVLLPPATPGSAAELIRNWAPVPGAGLVEAVIAGRREDDGEGYR